MKILNRLSTKLGYIHLNSVTVPRVGRENTDNPGSRYISSNTFGIRGGTKDQKLVSITELLQSIRDRILKVTRTETVSTENVRGILRPYGRNRRSEARVIVIHPDRRKEFESFDYDYYMMPILKNTSIVLTSDDAIPEDSFVEIQFNGNLQNRKFLKIKENLSIAHGKLVSETQLRTPIIVDAGGAKKTARQLTEEQIEGRRNLPLEKHRKSASSGGRILNVPSNTDNDFEGIINEDVPKDKLILNFDPVDLQLHVVLASRIKEQIADIDFEDLGPLFTITCKLQREDGSNKSLSSPNIFRNAEMIADTIVGLIKELYDCDYDNYIPSDEIHISFKEKTDYTCTWLLPPRGDL